MYKIETTIKKIVEMKGDFVVSLAPICKINDKNFLILLDKEDKSPSKIVENNENKWFFVCNFIKNCIRAIFNSSKKAIFYLEEQPLEILKAIKAAETELVALRKLLKAAKSAATKEELAKDDVEKMVKAAEEVAQAVYGLDKAVKAVYEIVKEPNAEDKAVDEMVKAAGKVVQAVKGLEKIVKAANTTTTLKNVEEKAAEVAEALKNLEDKELIIVGVEMANE